MFSQKSLPGYRLAGKQFLDQVNTEPAVTIGPATELLSPRQATKNELERILQPIDLSGCNVETREQLQQEMAMLMEGQEVPNQQFYTPLFKDKQGLRLTSWGTEEDTPRLDFAAIAGYAGQVPSFIAKIRQLLGQKRWVILVSHQASRLSLFPGGELGQICLSA